MKFLILIVILIAVYIAIEPSYTSKRMRNFRTKRNTAYNNPIQDNYMPYKKKFLLTKTEYSFYKKLKEKCDLNELLICPKVRLEDIAEVTTKNRKMKYRGYIKSRHVDFIICDKNLNPIAAIELDDYSHNSMAAQKTDNFKNELFRTIGLPLWRIHVSNNYDTQLNDMFYSLAINMPIPYSTPIS